MVVFIDFISLNIKLVILYGRIIILTFTYLIFLQDLQLFLDELRKAINLYRATLTPSKFFSNFPISL